MKARVGVEIFLCISKKYYRTLLKWFWCKNNKENDLPHFDSRYHTSLPIIRLMIGTPKSQRDSFSLAFFM
jgi:hypothetical protein